MYISIALYVNSKIYKVRTRTSVQLKRAVNSLGENICSVCRWKSNWLLLNHIVWWFKWFHKLQSERGKRFGR